MRGKCKIVFLNGSIWFDLLTMKALKCTDAVIKDSKVFLFEIKTLNVNVSGDRNCKHEDNHFILFHRAASGQFSTALSWVC